MLVDKKFQLEQALMDMETIEALESVEGQLQEQAKNADKLQDRFEELSEITRAEIVGAPEREIQINVDPYKMTAARVSFMDIENAVAPTVNMITIVSEN